MSNAHKHRQITVQEMAPHIHVFLPKENKVKKIAEWLINWINQSLNNGNIMPGDYLPSKGDLAFHTGVSIGTMQNVFRYVEDCGYVESKQKIGTYIKILTQTTEKLTSKREVTCNLIKKYLNEKHYKIGDNLISIRKLSSILGIPNTTIRIAINSLIVDNILEQRNNKFIVKSLKYKLDNKETTTLVDKILNHINNYIKQNLKKGDKLPASTTLADMYNVSLKTIHDAIKILSLAGILKTRRGNYGTIVANINEEESLYYYEQVELKIKQYISEKCKVNDKLPSIRDFAEVFEVSSKTIKKALDNIAYDGYITFARGRNGGTFVINIPENTNIGYTWLALSPEYEESK